MTDRTDVVTTPAEISAATWLRRAETRAVFDAIEAGGHAVRAVGGTVRDTLCGREVTDIDLATTALPEEVLRLGEAAGLRVVPTGLEHGTVTIIAGGIAHEVTTLRRDVETYGRRARVAFTTDWRADAGRRDFTMNALYCDRDGTIFDPLGGYTDLVAGRVRFIGDADARVAEDTLRILRFFRFHGEYGRGAIDAIGLAASFRGRRGLATLSRERVGGEFNRLLAAPGAPAVVATMAEHGLLAATLPIVPRLRLFAGLCAIERAEALGPDPLRRLAALALHSGDGVARLVEYLRLSNAQATRLAAIPPVSRAIHSETAPAEARRLSFVHGRTAFIDGLLLAWAGDTGVSTDVNRTDAWRALLRLGETWSPPAFPLAGRDLLALGLAPGPEVGKLLKYLCDTWIADDFVPDRRALMKQAEELIQDSTRRP